MHLRGILWVFFRVLLVGFSLFGPGAARAPKSEKFSRAFAFIMAIDIYIRPLIYNYWYPITRSVLSSKYAR